MAGAHRHVDTIFIKMQTRCCCCYIHFCRVGIPLCSFKRQPGRSDFMEQQECLRQQTIKQEIGSQGLAIQETPGPINHGKEWLSFSFGYQLSPTCVWSTRTGMDFFHDFQSPHFPTLIWTSETPILWRLDLGCFHYFVPSLERWSTRSQAWLQLLYPEMPRGEVWLAPALLESSGLVPMTLPLSVPYLFLWGGSRLGIRYP